MLDLRLPSGAFFAIVGIILIVTGGTVNLYSGLTMLGFGIILLLLSMRSSARRAHQIDK